MSYKKISEYHAIKLFNEFLDEINPDLKICGYTYNTSDALYRVDPIAYRQCFLDWLDSEELELE